MAATYEATDLYTLRQPANTTDWRAFSVEDGTSFGSAFTNGQSHGFIWTAPSGAATDLTPAGFNSSEVNDVFGTRQIGSAFLPGAGPRALLWNGSASSYVNLTPANWSYAIGKGTDGVHQVGYGGPQNGTHALLWSGTANSFVDLHPSAYLESYADAVGGNQQVGRVGMMGPDGEIYHAALWTGTAASVVDLHPGGRYTESGAVATDGFQQVGYGVIDWLTERLHPLLWSGSATSAVDLTPSGYVDAVVTDVRNGMQAGGAVGPGQGATGHATIWFSDADQFVDLHATLPAGFTSSVARSIDPAGHVFGFATDSTGDTHVIEWTAVPEPTFASAVLFLGVPMVLGRGRRTKRHGPPQP